MGGCSFFNFSLVRYRVNRVRAFYRAKGLRSQVITLENGSSIHCWVPREGEVPKPKSKPKPKPKRRWRRQGQGQDQGRGQDQRQGQDQREGQDQPPPVTIREKPALVFIHGFGGDGTIGWENQIGLFTKDYRVFVPDLLFFGSSTTNNVQRTEIFQADCIKEMLTTLNVQEVLVVGTSYGGFVAFWMAYKYPRFCRKVAICSSGVCMNPRTNDPLLKECNLTSIDEILLPTTVDGLKLAFSVIYAKPPGLPDFIAQQILDLFYSLDSRPHRVELLNALVIGSEKCPPLPVIPQEVLIIWGREDQVFKLSLAHQLQQHLGVRTAQLAIIEGAGHLPQTEKSREFNAILADFLDDSSQGDSV